MSGEATLQGLPRHVRFFLRQSRKKLPRPRYQVRVERGIRIPMPDGTYQVADRYVPARRIDGGPDSECPTLLVRCPYGRGFPYDYLYGALYAEEGFHVVIASCRGTAGSTGDFEPFTADAADAQATVGWLREQPWFSGSLGTVGASYLGYAQWALAADPPPELKAMAIEVSSPDFRNFLYPGGALALESILTGVSSMLAQQHGFGATVKALVRLLRAYKKVEASYPLLDNYEQAFGQRVPWLEEWLRHPAPDDPYWSPRAADVAWDRCPPTFLLGGWHDIMIDDTLDAYQRLRASGRQARLVVGPWNHTSAHSKDMPVAFGEALAWLRYHLTGEGSPPPESPVRVHLSQTGQHPGQWRDLRDWPDPAMNPRTFGLSADGGLIPALRSSSQPRKFRYDPESPTPSVGGPRMDGNGSGQQDNTLLEQRPDVLLYTGPLLDRPLDVVGPVSLTLRVRASSPDFDVFARLCDVNPGGLSRNICDGILRIAPGADGEPERDVNGEDGNGEEEAGGWREIIVSMSATAHRFDAGHQLRVQVSGGAHPRFARNTGGTEQLPTATSLRPVSIEVAGAVLSLHAATAEAPMAAGVSGLSSATGQARRLW